MLGSEYDQAAALMVEKADRWYYGERDVCGFATEAEPPCVKSPGHDGDHNGTYQPAWVERFAAWIDHNRVENQAAMAREREEAGNCLWMGHGEAFMAGCCDCGLSS